MKFRAITCAMTRAVSTGSALSFRRRIVVVAGAMACVACAPKMPSGLTRWHTPDAATRAEVPALVADDARTGTQDTPVALPLVAALPASPPLRTNSSKVPPPVAAAPASDNVADVTVSFDQLSLPAFIQVIYGSILKKSLSLDPAVSARTDLVTFRASKPQSPAQINILTRQLLKSYGISVLEYDGLVRFVPDTNSAGQIPQLRRGRAQPEVPLQLRPVFHLVELEVVRSTDVSQSLRSMFGPKLTVIEDQARAGLLIFGQPDDVSSALDIIQVLDQPVLRGSRSVRLNPTFWGAEDFARRLANLMAAQGYSVAIAPDANAPLLFFPVAPLNAVFVFSSSDATLAQAVEWAKELDKPIAGASNSGGLFSYAVKHGDARALATVFGELYGSVVAGGSQAQSSASGSSGLGGAAQRVAAPAAAPVPGAPRVVVNPATNSILIQGGKADDARQWQQLLTELDRPTRSALVEVIVAELILDEDNSLGVQFTLNDILRKGGSITGGTLDAWKTGGGFALNFLNNAGQTRGILRALQTDKRSRVLSSPKIVAKNGEFATIQVGTELPVVSSSQTNTGGGLFGGNSNAVQSIQYRSTGVILKVKPVIHSSNRMDLDISQEVSSSDLTQTGVASSPIISNRKIDTKLTLRDGSSVLLAGLISDKSIASDEGVTGIKDVPILGNLFKSTNRNSSRTELVILITGYILNDEYEAEAITESFKNSLGDWARELLPKAALSTRPPTVAAPLSTPAPAPAAAPPSALYGKSGLPAPRPAVPVFGSERAAPAPDDGVQMSRPAASLAPAPSSSAAAPEASPVPARAAAPLPPGQPAGKPVSDSNLLKELEAMRRAAGGK